MITQTELRRQRIILEAGYIDFSRGLNRYASIRTHDNALADDLIQSTFLKTWSYIVRGGKIQMMEAFLYHVLKALIIDEYRKHKPTSLDVLIEKGFEPAIDETHRFLDMLDGREAVLLISQLPILYQKVMKMRYVQDLSIKEIAILTNQTKNTVAVQTYRGLEKLKALYQEQSKTQTTHQHIHHKKSKPSSRM